MTDPLRQNLRDSAHASTAPPTEGAHLTGSPRHRDPDASADTGRPPDRDSAPITPRWVKVFGITAIVLLLLFAGLHLTGNAPTHMPDSSGTEHDLRQAP